MTEDRPGYGPDGLLDPARLRARLAEFEPLARDRPEEVRIFRAPGRVNLIGEHTDYNDGLVLPAAIGLEIHLCLVPADDRRVEITLDDDEERDGFDLDAIGNARESWRDYMAGVAWALSEKDVPLRGFRGLLASTLPKGSGLSSSAALELVSAWSLSASVPPALDGMTLARACQRAENAYVGVNSGLMDQFASSLGEAGSALMLDCRSLEYRPVALPLAECTLVAIDTKSPRRLETSEYNARRAQCEEAVRLLAREDPSMRALRDVDIGMLERLRTTLDEETFRRCEHVVRENERVLEAVAALERGDLDEVGRLFAASHASLRDLYEVSSPELDALVEIARSVDGVVAARMTGAGFGGCTVNLVRREAVEALREAVAREYPERTGRRAAVYVVEPVEGAGQVEPERVGPVIPPQRLERALA